jgi:hypothetical protein
MSLSHLPRLPLAAAALCAALALSACGGSDHNSSDVSTPPTSGTPPPVAPVASDSFYDFVLARVNAFIDNEEPAAIDGLTESKPENTEPVPVN